MENEMTRINPQPPVRDIGVITAEIKELKRQAQTMAVCFAIEMGRRLIEAKEALPHGEWGKWLAEEVEFSQSTANNYMRLFEEYGAPQLTLFGAAVNSQSIANLSYTKALLLLAVPKEEREAFAAEVKAEDLSVKELKAAIDERDKALKVAETQKQLKEEYAAKWKAADEARLETLKKASDAEALQGQLDQMTAQVEREREAARELREKLDEAKKNPTVPKATLDKLRREAEEAAKKTAEAEAQEALDEARKKAEKATAEAIKAKNAETEARRSLEEAQRKLKTASPEVAAFKALFDDLQSSAARLRGMIDQIRTSDAETADKLSAALKAFGSTL